MQKNPSLVRLNSLYLLLIAFWPLPQLPKTHLFAVSFSRGSYRGYFGFNLQPIWIFLGIFIFIFHLRHFNCHCLLRLASFGNSRYFGLHSPWLGADFRCLSFGKAGAFSRYFGLACLRRGLCHRFGAFRLSGDNLPRKMDG